MPSRGVNHLSMAQCAGIAGAAFGEVQSIWRQLQTQWAAVFGEACRAVTDALEMPPHLQGQDGLDLERAIKWKFLIPILLLRKPPSSTGTRAAALQAIVQRRLVQYSAGNWKGLVRDYEANMVTAREISPREEKTMLLVVKTYRLIYGDYLYKHGCNTTLVVTKGDTR